MTTPSHTPGPWSVNENDLNGDPSEYYIFVEPNVAVIERKTNGVNDLPDARLIAAAPELLDACNALLGLLQLVNGRPDIPADLSDILRANHRVAEATAAISKATGVAV